MIHDEFWISHLFLFFFVMKFGRVALKLVNNYSQVYINLIIGFIFIKSVNNFIDTNLILSVSS